MNYAKELAFAKDLAHQAGNIMLRYFRSTENEITIKADKTPVTLADTSINRLVIEQVEKEYPGYSVHGEEEQLEIKDNTFTWVCDPVDGTMPFARGIPVSTFSLALVNDKGDSVLGVVYDPFQDRLFEAVIGQGAKLNGEKIHVSDIAAIDNAFIDLEMWVNKHEGIMFDDPRDLLSKAGAKVMTYCSCCFTGCLVASGAYEATIFGQTKPEDIAALAVIVPEAGGKVTDLFGNTQRYDSPITGAIISNGKIHDELVALVGQTNYQSPVSANKRLIN